MLLQAQKRDWAMPAELKHIYSVIIRRAGERVRVVDDAGMGVMYT